MPLNARRLVAGQVASTALQEHQRRSGKRKPRWARAVARVTENSLPGWTERLQGRPWRLGLNGQRFGLRSRFHEIETQAGHRCRTCGCHEATRRDGNDSAHDPHHLGGRGAASPQSTAIERCRVTWRLPALALVSALKYL